MKLESSRALVTGAAGFIGSHLVESLVLRGARVRCLVRYNSAANWGWLEHLQRGVRDAIEIVPGDLRDPHGVERAVHGVDLVFHLGALIGIPYSYRSPGAYVETNVVGTLNVLEAARSIGDVRVVHTSTSEVYGSARHVPIDEEHPLHGQSPYSATKIAADQLALSYWRSFATPVVVVRPFNTYGPRQSTRAVIPTIISQIAAGADRIKLGSLEPTRDFVFVSDTVRGFIAAAETDAPLGQVVNLGTGHEISIGDTVRLIGQVMGRQVEAIVDRDRVRPASSEVDRLCADNSRALRLLGWEPEFAGQAGLRRGLEVTAEWLSRAENIARAKPGEYVV